MIEQLPTGPRRQVAIENRTVLICPHCWAPGEVARELPELAALPISDRLCSAHFQVLLARGLEIARLAAPLEHGKDHAQAG